MKDLFPLFKLLHERALRIVMIPHHSPDGDALGSALGLSHYLQKKGHHTQVISPSDYPDFLAWLPGVKQVLHYSESCPRCAEAFQQADLLFFMDCSSMQRVGGAMQEAIARCPAPHRALIDHHPNVEEGMADYRVWSSRAAATSQLVFDFICLDQGEALIDKDIAECLYTGIVTDTSSFRFSTTPRLHHIAARLVQKGNLQVREISDLLYGNYSLQRMRFLGFALNNCLQVYPKLHTAFFVLKAKEVQRFHPKHGDTEGLVNYALSIEGIRLGALIKELNNEVRLSFRSKGNFAVNDMAKQYFNGGGHRNAAGASCHEAVHKVVNRFKALLPKYKKELAHEAATTRSVA